MDAWIFAVGLGTFSLLIAGVVFTFVEFRRVNQSDRPRERGWWFSPS